MGWATIIGNQDGSEVEQMQEIGEGGLSGDIQHTLMLDSLADGGSLWFLRCDTDQDNVERFVHEELLDEGHIAAERPSADAQPWAGVGVDDHELFRRIEWGMSFLQEVPYLGASCGTGGEDREREGMVCEADFCQRHLSAWRF